MQIQGPPAVLATRYIVQLELVQWIWELRSARLAQVRPLQRDACCCGANVE